MDYTNYDKDIEIKLLIKYDISIDDISSSYISDQLFINTLKNKLFTHLQDIPYKINTHYISFDKKEIRIGIQSSIHYESILIENIKKISKQKDNLSINIQEITIHPIHIQVSNPKIVHKNIIHISEYVPFTKAFTKENNYIETLNSEISSFFTDKYNHIKNLFPQESEPIQESEPNSDSF